MRLVVACLASLVLPCAVPKETGPSQSVPAEGKQSNSAFRACLTVHFENVGEVMNQRRGKGNFQLGNKMWGSPFFWL